MKLNLNHLGCKLSRLIAGYLIKDLDRKSTVLAPQQHLHRCDSLKRKIDCQSVSFHTYNANSKTHSHRNTQFNPWCLVVELDKELSPGERRISSFKPKQLNSPFTCTVRAANSFVHAGVSFSGDSTTLASLDGAHNLMM